MSVDTFDTFSLPSMFSQGGPDEEIGALSREVCCQKKRSPFLPVPSTLSSAMSVAYWGDQNCIAC